jgi:Arc/MetJ family transcription regulator
LAGELYRYLLKNLLLAIHIFIVYYVYQEMEVITIGRTNIVLDDKLVTKCRKATGIRTYKALIDYALHELLRHESQLKILELKGKIHWEGDITTWRKGRTR